MWHFKSEMKGMVIWKCTGHQVSYLRNQSPVLNNPSKFYVNKLNKYLINETIKIAEENIG